MKNANNSRKILLSGLSTFAVMSVAAPALAQTENAAETDSNIIISRISLFLSTPKRRQIFKEPVL